MMNKISDTDTWKHILCSCIGIINIIKVTTIPKANYRFNAIRIKLSVEFFKELVTKKLRPRITNVILREKKGAGGIRLPELTQYCKATVIKTVWFWHSNSHRGQWNETES